VYFCEADTGMIRGNGEAIEDTRYKTTAA
jgi:hypothetical protein